MRKLFLLFIVLLTAGGSPAFAYQILWEVYQDAPAFGDYDAYIELDPAIEYEGPLNIVGGVNVYINGNGAIIHGNSGVSVGVANNSNLDIENCVIVGGIGGIYVGPAGSGTINNNTITGMSDAGIRTYYPNHSAGVFIINNIITDCYYGFIGIEYELPEYIGYNTVYDAWHYRYAEFCPG